MVVSETETVAYDNLTRELAPSSPSLPLPQSEQESNQNSILSLTLDEIQCKSGRMFGSMSMDEFLANIWSSDDNQQVESPPPTHEEAVQNKSVAATEPKISQQASLSVPPPICKKTVDEIWSEIHKDLPPQQNEANGLSSNGSLKKQRTLGEMTLEDFLIKAGVVQESSLPIPFKSSPQPRTSFPLQNDTGKMANNRPFDASCNTGPAKRLGFSTQQNVGSCMSGKGIAAYQMFSQSHSLGVREATTTSAVEKCQSLTETSGNSSKKRIIDGPPEVVVERRQRRMLKNRESAARSRARRQAYTVELEAGLTQLRQENEKLKEILAEAERKRKLEAAQRKHSTKAQKRTEKFRAIRRTASVAW